MRQIKIDLTPEEEKVFEFRLYQYQGLQIAINQFISTNEFEYNEEHYDRIIDTLAEKYGALKENIFELLQKRRIEDSSVLNCSFEYSKGVLELRS